MTKHTREAEMRRLAMHIIKSHFHCSNRAAQRHAMRWGHDHKYPLWHTKGRMEAIVDFAESLDLSEGAHHGI